MFYRQKDFPKKLFAYLNCHEFKSNNLVMGITAVIMEIMVTTAMAEITIIATTTTILSLIPNIINPHQFK